MSKDSKPLSAARAAIGEAYQYIKSDIRSDDDLLWTALAHLYEAQQIIGKLLEYDPVPKDSKLRNLDPVPEEYRREHGYSADAIRTDS